MRILVVEDDRNVAAFLVKGLRESGYTVDHAADGKEGLFLATSERYGALVVDRMLPSLDGLSIVRALRAAGDHTPALILSALGEVDDRVLGLRAGGATISPSRSRSASCWHGSRRCSGDRSRPISRRRSCASLIWKWIC
jgi:DNA-binding response OmpR family regulator